MAGGIVDDSGVTGSAPVPLTVIDSWPDASGHPLISQPPSDLTSPSAHGYNLAVIAQSLSMLPGSVNNRMIDIRTVRAMRLNDQTMTLSSSVPGTHGYLSDLAEAIYVAIRPDDRPGHSPNQAHVLSTSMGWHRLVELGGDIGSTSAGEKAPAGAVFAALQYANCRGALVFAAGGNALSATDYDPIYPAAYTTRLALDSAGCDREFGITHPQHQRSLVQSVHATLADGRSFSSGLQGAISAFGAFGLHATAKIPGTALYLHPSNGSSYATIVASTAAAVAWFANRSLPPNEVLSIVHRSGALLNESPVLHDGHRTQVRQIKVCSALEESCRTTGSCPQGTRCGSASPYTPPMPAFPVAVGTPSACRPPNAAVSGLPDCTLTVEGIDHRPHTGPQPGEVICTVYYAKADLINQDLTVVLEMEANMLFYPDWLKITDGMASYSFNLSQYFSTPLAANMMHQVTVPNLNLNAQGPFKSTIYFGLVPQKGPPLSTTTELPVY